MSGTYGGRQRPRNYVIYPKKMSIFFSFKIASGEPQDFKKLDSWMMASQRPKKKRKVQKDFKKDHAGLEPTTSDSMSQSLIHYTMETIHETC